MSDRYAGSLTQVPKADMFARCSHCRLIYLDSLPSIASVRCPRCFDAVERGLTKEQALALLDEDGFTKQAPF